MTFGGRPLAGRMIGHSGAVRRGSWTEIDLTEGIAGTVARDGGSASFALTNSPYGVASATLAERDRESRRFASRETDRVPELVVVHGTPTSSTVPSSTTISTHPSTTVAPAVTSTLPPTTSPPRPPHASITPGTTGSFQFSGYAPLRDRPLKVWYDAPSDVTTAKVLVVMHGQSRTGEDYRNSWIAHARRAGALLVVPEFTEALYPGSDAYNLGNMEREPESRWSFSLIEPLFDHIRADTGNRSDGYYLYGHSAGAQFVHRFLLFKPNRVKRAVAANAGWYTAPEPSVDFPYGLRGSPITDAGLRRALAAPLTVLLGENDTDTNDPDLRHSSEADRQGPHRLARGHFFFAAGRTTAGALGTPFGWTLQTVPGAVHSNGDMAAAAARSLFG
jgi:pimeloyl-ACP methyl ester carboxylesterase